MARPKTHSDNAARRQAYLAEKRRFDLIVDKVIADTIDKLAHEYGASRNEVIGDLLRYALTNRNWMTQGLLWAKGKGPKG